MHACTITTSHYLAHARLLGESFCAKNPGASFSVLLVDDSRDGARLQEPFELLVPSDIGIDQAELERRATMYITQALAVSMKPDLLLALLGRGHETVLFIDADGCIYDGLGSLAELARRHSLVLSPHSNDPYPLWEQDSPEQTFIRAGSMNAGLLAVSRAAEPFLRWWAQRTARRCVFDPPRGLFLEQTWLMLAPAFFRHHILRDRGCNVAGWNLHTRDVDWRDGEPTIDGGPLRHFHFAMSYDPERPERLTASEHARWWPSLRERPGVERLSREYAERLIAHGYREARRSPPLFDAMPNGAPIEAWMRADYRAALIHAEALAEAEPPNPFAHGSDAFAEWVRSRTAARLSERATHGYGTGTAREPEADSSAVGSDAERFGAEEMSKALMDASELLGRIRELERARDEAIAWAERVSDELEQAKASIARHDEAIVQRDRLIGELQAALAERLAQLDEVWHSLSWRVTRPLRAAKGAPRR